ncbi:Swt1 family HEPN domain-containing protein [Mesorhizobium shangrilense]|uniref:Swt1 family HEPN domain-containing protein n=1 Tax=Mesorhizobium shangrilense TaxID=460060 RepID=A0ABV2DLA4_9HYPH
MIDLQRLELFVLKCAVIQADVEKFGRIDNPIAGWDSSVSDSGYDEYVSQFSEDSRSGARKMASYYELFYLIENDIRRIIHETLEESHGRSWWDVCVDQAVKDEVEKNRKRELELALSIRSEREIDYTTFGQLGDIIRKNWTNFAGIMSNQPALSRVLHQLNVLRGTIAHCGFLAEDEVDRLHLTIKDWFRVMAGPR